MALQNFQYDTIMREYSRRQSEVQRALEERRKEAYTRVPRLLEIDQEIASLSARKARALLLGQPASIEELREEVAALANERISLLKANGFPADYLKPHYFCRECQDTGYTDGHRKCACFKKAEIELLYTQSNLTEILKKENFEHFSFDWYSDTIKNEATGLTARQTAQRAYDTAWNFVQDFDSRFQNLFFYGNTGVGKTFLSNCIAKELLDRGFSVIYFTAFQLFDIFAKNVFDKDTDASVAHQNIFDCDLLIIDDLGTEMSNSFTTSQFFLCLNERLLRRKSTIISTNFNMNQLADIYSERTFSRVFSNYTMLKFYGDDIRIKKKLH